jgi:hypothetical protein
MKTKLLKLADDMYQINRQISLKYIAFGKERTLEDMNYVILALNKSIANWIKELRTLAEDSNGNV